MEKYNEYLSNFSNRIDEIIENRRYYMNGSSFLIKTNDIAKTIELCKQYGIKNNIKNVILDFNDIYFYELLTFYDADICLLNSYNSENNESIQININEVDNYINIGTLVLYRKAGNEELYNNDYGKKLLDSENCIFFITGLENRMHNSDESHKRRQILDFMRINCFEHLLTCVCIIPPKIDDWNALTMHDGKDQFEKLEFIF